jgi:hypothetical protein
MGSTRFNKRGAYDATNKKHLKSVANPTVGSLQIVSKRMECSASATEARKVELPTGMGFEVVGVKLSAEAKTGTVIFKMGTAALGAGIVAAKAITTTTINATIVDGTVPAGGAIYISATAAAGETATGVDVTIVGYANSEPTAVSKR